MDWATQPNPFRRFDGAPPLAPPETIREFLRCSLGLSAWKQYGASRWALRVNPSSGNLHPTEGYVITAGGVFHYAPREHILERRCEWNPQRPAPGLDEDTFLVALSSIHWREAWKYGERAFRYCQHDAGHAIGALRIAAALLGWTMRLLPHWSHAQMASLLGLDRESDFADAEPEEAECIAIVTRRTGDAFRDFDPAPLVEAARAARWTGRANRLSPQRTDWPIIGEVAEATRAPGIRDPGPGIRDRTVGSAATRQILPTREIILRRRSALGFDGVSSLSRDLFVSMLLATVPRGVPWDAIWWPPYLHLALFVHRVEGLHPGIYVFLRDAAVVDSLRAALRREFLWEPVDVGDADGKLFLLLPIDCRQIAERLACDQAIAADGFFSLAMLARFEPALRERGEWFYRHLFWESGVIGQVLYLAAEGAGARATGIGCYYDDPVHEVLGLAGRDWQCLYEFSTGMPVEDLRLTTEPGYPWEHAERRQ
jgi:SagB-type dehydrogenase family enzyme